MEEFLQYEKDLPKLPVPSLNSSVQQVLTALKPLVTDEEYGEVFEEASRFLTDDGILLAQAHLEAAAKNDSISCYLNAVNGESYPGVYGDLRGDILPRNPYLVLEEDPYSQTINPPNQAQRAASLINSSLKFIVSMRNGTLKRDTTPKLGTPLTMNCYKNLFGSTRVPDTDTNMYHLVTIQKYKEINDSRHVVFICNNQFYTLEVLTPCLDPDAISKHDIWFNDAELAGIVQSILDDASAVGSVLTVNNAIGSITTLTYSLWKSARTELCRSNSEALQAIDDALFVVSLDHTIAPVSEQEKTVAISHGTSNLFKGTNIQVGSCTSRWYDKLQLVVTANAVAGVVWESSTMDSTAILRFISDIYIDSILKLARNINGAERTLFDANIRFASARNVDLKPVAKILEFNKTPEVANLVHLSETRLTDLIHQHEYKTLTVKLDSHLLAKLDILVDSFLQIGFQISNYALYGKISNTLEPITTRKFRDARTELIVVQNDLIAGLVKLFITSSDNLSKWDALKHCCEIHKTLYRDAMHGKGFERHFGALVAIFSRPSIADNLNKLNKDLGLAPLNFEEMRTAYVPLLSSYIFEKLTNVELLISNCGNPALRLFGIPPAIDQGFGIGYIIHKDRVVVTVSSKHRQTERFLDTFESVVHGMKQTLRSEADVLLEIADTELRKHELQKLRIEKELKNVNDLSSGTRHPIDISIRNTPLSGSSANLEAQGENSDDNHDDLNYSLLGGYGFFDVDEVDHRREELSHAESYMNSYLHLPSNMVSSSNSKNNSRHQSSINLLATAAKGLSYDLKQRLLLGDKIRDQLSPSLNESLANLTEDYDCERKEPGKLSDKVKSSFRHEIARV